MNPGNLRSVLTLFFCMFLLVSCSKTKEEYLTSARGKAGAGDYAGAIVDYSKVIEMDSQDAAAYGGRAYAKRLTGDFSGAIQDYSKAIELKPTVGDPYAGRGMAKISMGDKDGGCVDLNKSLELGYTKAEDLIKENCSK